jgi:hypothetical protein
VPTGIRFRPPPVDLTPEIRWVLLRSLGPLEILTPPGFDPATASDLAVKLGVAARIAARMGRDALVSEIGDAAAPLLANRVTAVGAELAQERTIERCVAISESTTISIALLKSHKLRLSGRMIEGSRRTADVDLLVSDDCALEYHAALLAAGFVTGELEGPGVEQHLAPLADPESGIVEVHTRLLGVSTGKGDSMRWSDLRAADGLRRLPAAGATCFIPSDEMLTAHALAHGIAQNGRRPNSYALLWMLGDLIDLEAESRPVPIALVAASVSEEEACAALELAGALGRGDLVEGWGEISGDARKLLSSILAGWPDAD